MLGILLGSRVSDGSQGSEEGEELTVSWKVVLWKAQVKLMVAFSLMTWVYDCLPLEPFYVSTGVLALEFTP